MIMTRHKKQILEFYKPENRDSVKLYAGDPPFDVSGVAGLLYSGCQRYHIEATRRTLNAMVSDGLLYRVKVREPRFDVRIGGDGAHCTVVRYGLVENHTDQ
ncbi:hypothetical protein [Escherichia coli]|uniref:hypothetical protein n=1 Tax=Escherichia coli TaxID=562 RepID=UPI000C245E5B|nr:hypothetical protein [Escherichia coli]PJI60767.1 hypothetical protein CTU84_01205 [Escherichia coli]PJI65337.1 hypothetical protein CTY41_00765 [Escherichia coli]